jgi:DNA-directed RNA polymerase subunit RPC12/RpoP
MKCPRCNSKLVWQNDFDYEDVNYIDSDEYEGVYSMWNCTECETEVNLIDKWLKGKDNEI